MADVVIAGLDAREVSGCLALLPEPQRLCIVIMDVAGYTARETAQALGCPRGTVLAGVHRSRRKLAQLLDQAGCAPQYECDSHTAENPHQGKWPARLEMSLTMPLLPDLYRHRDARPVFP